MSTFRNDPLSPEEQALASRLHDLGGPGGPSAALDARVLAAARKSTAKPAPRRRWWPAWMGIPGGVITAVGTAAAFVVAVGVVWHTQPPMQPRPAQETHAADGVMVPVEVIDVPARTAAPAATAAADSPAAAIKQAPARPRAAVPSRPSGEPATGMHAAASAAPPSAAEASPSTGVEASPTRPAPASASASAMATDAAATAAPDPVGFATPEAQETALPQARRPTYTSSARARPEARPPSRNRSPAPADGTPAHAQPAGASLPVDVNDDLRLAPGQWLERIRERRARGDAEAARESLRRFRQRHPDVQVPADLHDLAG